MPLDIDPRWEYWQPDPEVAEALECEAAAGLEQVMDGRLHRRGAQGLRFGRGSPDAYEPREGRERVSRRPEPPRHRECAACGQWFLPDRAGRRYCSLRCRPAPGAPRRLGDLPCAYCGLAFRPRGAGAKFCSRVCAGLAQRREGAPAGCRHCGGPLPPSRSRNQSQPRLYCSKGCGSAARSRRERRAQEEAS